MYLATARSNHPGAQITVTAPPIFAAHTNEDVIIEAKVMSQCRCHIQLRDRCECQREQRMQAFQL
jgi:hypothetical protein